MKILSFSDINLLDSPLEKLQSIITSENIDIVILLGGLFSKSSGDQPGKKKKKSQDTQNSKILELNWLLVPILVIPDEEDLKLNRLIKQVQGQEAVWIRYIHNKGTIIDSWFIFSITETEEDNHESLMKNIEEYSKIAPDRSILLYIGKNRVSFPKVSAILLKQDFSGNNNDSFIVSIDSISDQTVTIIDLDQKTVSSMSVQ